MTITTLCLCIKNGALLLATKKTSFGAGKLNAAGGKVKKRESLRRATVRELKEEFGLTAKSEDLGYAAILHFYFDDNQLFTCHVFTLREWAGTPRDTKEMGGFEWHHHTNLPFHRMWAGDKIWLPHVMQGKKLEASIYFNADGTEVQSFRCEERILTE